MLNGETDEQRQRRRSVVAGGGGGNNLDKIQNTCHESPEIHLRKLEK